MDTSIKMALGFAAVALSITGAWIAWPKPSPQPEAPKVSILDVTPERLLGDLSANSVMARDTYMGKTVRFTGPIDMILDLKRTNTPAVSFHVPGVNGGELVVGYDPSFRKQIGTLREGDSVTCVGVVDDMDPVKISMYVKGSALTK